MLKKIIIGFCAGIISGLFSAGGGLILVPAFTYVLKLNESESRATSLYAILPMVIVSGIYYNKGNFIDWNLGIKCAIGGMFGGYVGSKLLKKISTIIYSYLTVFAVLNSFNQFICINFYRYIIYSYFHIFAEEIIVFHKQISLCRFICALT